MMNKINGMLNKDFNLLNFPKNKMFISSINIIKKDNVLFFSVKNKNNNKTIINNKLINLEWLKAYNNDLIYYAKVLINSSSRLKGLYLNTTLLNEMFC